MIEEREEKGFIHAQLGRRDRQVGERGASGTSELADAVDRVVVIEEEQVLPAGLEGIGLAKQLERVGGIGGEDDGVFAGIGMKKSSTKARACSFRPVEAREVGLSE